MPCAPQPLVAGSRRWRHRVRLDEAVISSAEGGTLFGLCEPLSPSRHLPTRVAPPLSRRCQSLTTGARGRWSSRLVPVSSSSLATFKEGLQGAPPARIFARKMSLLSAAQNFLPLRGADKMAPCGAGNLFDREGRAKKSCRNIVLALNRRGSSRWSRESSCGGPAGPWGRVYEPARFASLRRFHPCAERAVFS